MIAGRHKRTAKSHPRILFFLFVEYGTRFLSEFYFHSSSQFIITNREKKNERTSCCRRTGASSIGPFQNYSHFVHVRVQIRVSRMLYIRVLIITSRHDQLITGTSFLRELGEFTYVYQKKAEGGIQFRLSRSKKRRSEEKGKLGPLLFQKGFHRIRRCL